MKTLEFIKNNNGIYIVSINIPIHKNNDNNTLKTFLFPIIILFNIKSIGFL